MLKAGLLGAVKPGALKKARGLLEAVSHGEKVKPIDLAKLTDAQLAKLNEYRAVLGQPLFTTPDAIYRGTHHLESRGVKNPNSIDELLAQLESGLSDNSRVILERAGPALKNPIKRTTEFGDAVNDKAVLIAGRGNVPEVQSIIPIGDRFGPKGKQAPPGGTSGSTPLSRPPEPIARPPSPVTMDTVPVANTIAPTKQQRNLETARRNAVEMLGLPENNTANRGKADLLGNADPALLGLMAGGGLLGVGAYGLLGEYGR